jgi:hypothetical protein
MFYGLTLPMACSMLSLAQSCMHACHDFMSSDRLFFMYFVINKHPNTYLWKETPLPFFLRFVQPNAAHESGIFK